MKALRNAALVILAVLAGLLLLPVLWVIYKLTGRNKLDEIAANEHDEEGKNG